jgi:ubiquinone/menaquinone biosynthesis C-methylase UbiE
MPTQVAVQRWFNRTYAEQGLTYLRPSEFYSVFMEYLEVRPGQRLLDIGCGPGLLLGEAVRCGARSCGIDLSQTALAMARRGAPGARIACSNAETLPFRDGWFDGVTCIGTLEHFLSAGRALAEMRRVLKAAGRACIMVPNVRALKWRFEAKLLHAHDEDSHERAATLEEWRSVLTQSGFAIERIERDEWPRRRRLFGARYLVPLRWATQYVFLLRP